MTIDLFTDSPVGIGQFAYQGTGAVDPGAGNFTKPNATTLLFDNLSQSGADITAMLDAAAGGHLQLYSQEEDSTYPVSLVVDSTGFRTVTVTAPQSSTGFVLTVGKLYALQLVGAGGTAVPHGIGSAQHIPQSLATFNPMISNRDLVADAAKMDTIAPGAVAEGAAGDSHAAGSVGGHADFDLTGVALNLIPKWDGTKFTMQADNNSGSGGSANPRNRAVSVVTVAIPAGVLVANGVNTDAALLDYDGLTFETDVEVHINGRIMRGGPLLTSNFDVSPGAAGAERAAGSFYSERPLAVGDTIQMFVGGGAIGSAPWVEDVFVPTLGQVSFILSSTPTDTSSLSLRVNGIEAVEVTDYTLSGLTLTWLNTQFSFETSDGVVAQYK